MSYPIERSPLFGIKSIHNLADVLQIRVGRLRNLDYLTAQFKEGVTERNGKERKTETPVRSMRGVHNRVQALLSRIQTPEYLHSGKRKRSYLTNASTHEGQAQTFQVDIAKFYPSCTWHQVYMCFAKRFGCASDVSGILASLLTYNDHIPTGSPNSSLLAFFVQKEMFDALDRLAGQHDLRMSVLQDDVTFSGGKIDEPFRARVRQTIKQNELTPKRSKQRFSHGGMKPEITGVVMTPNGPKAPWSRHRALKQAIDAFDVAEGEEEIRSTYHRAMGRLTEIEQVQGKLFDLKPRLKIAFRERLADLG